MDQNLADYVRREEDVVIAKLEAKLVACRGVDAVLPRLRDAGYRLADEGQFNRNRRRHG